MKKREHPWWDRLVLIAASRKVHIYRLLASCAGTLVLLTAFCWPVTGQAPQQSDLSFGASNELTRPQNYREWVYLSSGLGMSYGPLARTAVNPPFDNVFVRPESYRSFLRTGLWPDKTAFVLELRSSLSKGSINKDGHFQGNLNAIEVEVKDESRFAGKWGFYQFSSAAPTAKPLPTSAECYSCHARNGAVDNTFVQFYPTLIDVARQKGTFKESPETAIPSAASHAFRGLVEAVDVNAKTITVAGEEVPGWMRAMTMTYTPDNVDVVGHVKTGDRITATVHDGEFGTLYDVQVSSLQKN